MENDANVLALFASATGKLPAFIKDAQPSALTQLLAGSEAVKRLSIGGGVFRLLLGRQELAEREERSMNIVIVAAAPAYARTFYGSAFDPDSEPTAPLCWSDDGKHPAETCTSPQAAACMRCPHDREGTGQNGQGRACRTSARVAVALDGALEDGLVAMNIPAASIFGQGNGRYSPLQEYARKLAGFNISLEKVLTEVRFDTKATFPRIMFQAVRPLTEAEYNTVVGLSEETNLDPFIGPRKFNMERVIATAAGAAKAAVESEESVEDQAPEAEEEAPIAPPQKPKAAKAAPATEKSSKVEDPPPPSVRREADDDQSPADNKAAVLASLLNKWADDTAD